MTRRGHVADDTMTEMVTRLGSSPAGLDLPGPALEADAQVSVQVGRLATVLERQRSDDRTRRVERSHAIFPFDFNPQTIGLTGGAGTLNGASLYSPNEGYFWDIKKITAASFTTGTVALYKNAANDANAEVVFTQAGSYFFGTGQLLLNSNDFLVLVAAGITGNVTISGRAISVRADYLADYLL
jgi:hypothetical protein